MATASAAGIIELFSVLSYIAFIIAAIVMFIVDGVQAKQMGRPRRKVFIVLFIVAMVLLGISIVITSLLVFLVSAFMASM